MMSAVAGMAQKITEHCTQNNSAADAVPPSLFNLGLMISELETVVSALGRIDHLKFEDHVMIESLMVSESLGKVLLMQASNAHTRMLDDGMPRWGGILTFSIAAYDQIKPRGDKIHAANLELAKAF